MPRKDTFIYYVLACLPLLAAVMLYGYTIRLPLFLDDIFIFLNVRDTNGLEQWGGSVSFPYYRPTSFSIWKLSQVLADGYDPVGLHWINVFCFGVTGVAVGQITRRLWRQSWLAMVIAGMSYVIFPFNYQSVTLVSSLFHVALALGISLSLWAGLAWLDRGGWLVLLVCWISGFLGVFSHENGVLLAPLAIGLLLARYYDRPRPDWRRLAWVLVPQISFSLLYAALWFTVPLAREDDSLGRSADVASTFADLVQGLVYPFGAVVRLIVGNSDTPMVNVTLLLAAVITLPILAFLAWRDRRLAVGAGYGVGWYILAIIPSALLLDVGYVFGSPRLMMLASVGGSIFWGVVLARAMSRVRFVPHLFLLITLVISLNFLRARRTEFLLLGNYTWGLIETIERLDIQNEDNVLLVNAPNYLAPEKQTFLLGSEGSTLMLNGISYNQIYRLNANAPEGYDPIDSALWYRQTLKHTGSVFTPHDYPVEDAPLIERIKAVTHIITNNFDDGQFHPMFVGGSGLTGVNEPLITFTETGMTLNEFHARLSEDHRVVTIMTRWHQPTPSPVKMFAHVFCGATYIEQSDGYFWGDMYPFSVWQPGETLTDIRQIFLDEPIAPACLQIFTGVYWEANGVRLITHNEVTGEQVYNDIIQITDIEITDEPF